MISKTIYFIDSWVRTNVNSHPCNHDAESLAERCIADAAKAGFTNQQIEQDLGTDLVDFLSSELEARRAVNGRAYSN